MLLTDDQWYLIIKQIPALLRGTNMRNSSPNRERLILECILWKLAMDIPWYDLPEAYCAVKRSGASIPLSPRSETNINPCI